jgi:nitrite reductase (cytochrome c-552)
LPSPSELLRRAWCHPGCRKRLRLPLAIILSIFATGAVMRRAAVRDAAADGTVLSDTTGDAAAWGRRYPLHFRDWRGPMRQRQSAAGEDARLELDPRIARLLAGYPFLEEQVSHGGHAQSLGATDSVGGRTPPAACLTCHGSVYPELLRAGGGDMMRGADSLRSASYDDLRERVRHPVGCLDCHDPATMRLRVTRPAFVEGLRRERAAHGTRGYDVNRDASPQEMRTYVCAQCHAEYFLAGMQERLTLPWARGVTADSILAFYDSTGHADWVHPRSLAPVLKAQHPTYELFTQGAHARAGVTCADCHMPHRHVRGRDVTDHRTQNPLADVDLACRPCHDGSPKALQDRVAQVQSRTLELRTIALDALLSLIGDIEVARTTDSARVTLRAARDFQRRAQFLLDFVESERSTGFHAPQESARLLALSINFSRLGQTVVRGDGRPPIVDGPTGKPRRRVEVRGGSGLRRASVRPEAADGW